MSGGRLWYPSPTNAGSSLLQTPSLSAYTCFLTRLRFPHGSKPTPFWLREIRWAHPWWPRLFCLNLCDHYRLCLCVRHLCHVPLFFLGLGVSVLASQSALTMTTQTQGHGTPFRLTTLQAKVAAFSSLSRRCRQSPSVATGARWASLSNRGPSSKQLFPVASTSTSSQEHLQARRRGQATEATVALTSFSSLSVSASPITLLLWHVFGGHPGLMHWSPSLLQCLSASSKHEDLVDLGLPPVQPVSPPPILPLAFVGSSESCLQCQLLGESPKGLNSELTLKN